MSAAAGIVVTEMNTPISAPALASVSDTTPTIPASTATIDREQVRAVDQVGDRPHAVSVGIAACPRCAG